MLSRVADHLYWMSRYIERAENIARLMQVSVELLLDSVAFGSKRSDEYWTPVLAATAMEGAFRLIHPNPKPGDISDFLTLDERNPDSILSCIREARENARTIRDQISDEMWTELNALYLMVSSSVGADMLQTAPQSFFEKIIHSSLQFDGITEATLSRSEGWNFIQLGRHLERADKTSRFLDIKSQPTQESNEAIDSLQWGTILRACSASASYRRENGSELTLEKILQLLLFSVEFPRSVRFCVRIVDEMLHSISGTPIGRYSNPCEKKTGALLAKLSFADPADVVTYGLHQYIDDLQVALNDTGHSIFETYVLLPREYTKFQPTPADFSPFDLALRQQQQQQQQG